MNLFKYKHLNTFMIANNTKIGRIFKDVPIVATPDDDNDNDGNNDDDDERMTIRGVNL